MPALTTETWIVILAAPFIGSFLGVLIVRLPVGDNPCLGRSRCPSCGHTLGVPDLVPIVSWLALRGACRFCGARIGAFHPAIEIAATAVAVWAATVTDGWILVATCGLGWTLLTLAVIDQRHQILPDALTLPLTAAGIAVSALLPAAQPLNHAVGAALGFAVFFVVAKAYRAVRGREGLGLGDAKLLAAAGAWVSWTGLASVIFMGAALGLAATLVLRVAAGRPSAAEPIPFGPYLCLATWCTWLYGPISLAGG